MQNNPPITPATPQPAIPVPVQSLKSDVEVHVKEGRITLRTVFTDNKGVKQTTITRSWKVQLGTEQIKHQSQVESIATKTYDTLAKAVANIDIEWANKTYRDGLAITLPPPYWIDISFDENGQASISKISRSTHEKETEVVGGYTSKGDLVDVKARAQAHFQYRKALQALPQPSPSDKYEALQALAYDQSFVQIYNPDIGPAALDAFQEAFGNAKEAAEKAPTTDKGKTPASPVTKEKYQNDVKTVLGYSSAVGFGVVSVDQELETTWNELLKNSVTRPKDLQTAQALYSRLTKLQDELSLPSRRWTTLGKIARHSDIEPEHARLDLLKRIKKLKEGLISEFSMSFVEKEEEKGKKISPRQGAPVARTRPATASPQPQVIPQTPAAIKSEPLSKLPTQKNRVPPPSIPPPTPTKVDAASSSQVAREARRLARTNKPLPPLPLTSPPQPTSKQVDAVSSKSGSLASETEKSKARRLARTNKPLPALPRGKVAPLQPLPVSEPVIPVGMGIVWGDQSCFFDSTLQALRNCQEIRKFLNLYGRENVTDEIFNQACRICTSKTPDGNMTEAQAKENIKKRIAWRLQNFILTVEGTGSTQGRQFTRTEVAEFRKDLQSAGSRISLKGQDDARQVYGDILDYIGFHTGTVVQTMKVAKNVEIEHTHPAVSLQLGTGRIGHRNPLQTLLTKHDEPWQLGNNAEILNTLNMKKAKDDSPYTKDDTLRGAVVTTVDPKAAPKYMQINLQRYERHPDGTTKKDKTVVCDLAEIEISKVKYRLKAAVIHIGADLHSGHYVTLCPRTKPRSKELEWVLYDDLPPSVNKVVKLDDSSTLSFDATYKDLLEENAYLLFYEQVPAPESQGQGK
jgi:ubiquitin C-terminal hydrolase